jgi:diguanylate cyclase (GGDEF)-like protein/PAS domain S-box-containing protein
LIAVTSPLDWVTTAGFAALGVDAVARWRHGRTRTEGAVAAVLVLLALTSILARVAELVPHRVRLLATLAILLFELSGIGLLLLRDSFVPLGRTAIRAALAAVALSVSLFGIAGVAAPDTVPNGPQLAAIVLLVIVWAGCVGEPMVTLWRAAPGRPTVQRARLRALSIGYATIFAVLLLSAGPPSLAESTAVEWTVSILQLLVVPLLYVSFAPPWWVRRVWRHAEDEAARQAIDGLLTFTQNPAALARVALDHATRLVGADAGAVVTADGDVLAAVGMDDQTAVELVQKVQRVDRARIVRMPESGHVVAVPLPSSDAVATLLVRSGPFTPVFGSDEVTRLRDYGASLALAFDRVRQSMRYQSFLQAVSDIGEGLVITEAGRPVFVNDAYAALTGYSPEELMAMPSLLDLAPPEMRDDLALRLRDRMSGLSVPVQYVSQLVRKDGRRVAVENAVRVSEGDGRIIAVVRDISERRRTEDLRAMQFAVTRILGDCPTIEEAAPHMLRTIAAALECQAAGLWMLADGGDALALHSWWQLASVAGTEVPDTLRGARAHPGVGVAGQVLLSRAPAMVNDIAGDAYLPTTEHALRIGLRTAVGFPVFLDDRAYGAIELFARDELALGLDVVEIMADLGRQMGHFLERRQAERALHDSMEQLALVAATDPLTGLRNRRDFERRLTSLPETRFAILAVDVDNLKEVNDEYGHEGGDVVLQGVSRTLAALLRGSDVVARVGGDEFAVLLTDVDSSEAHLAAERMRVAVQNISLPYGQARISVGWAAGESGTDPHQIWRRADADLYAAKRNGRDRVGTGQAEERRGLPLRSAWRNMVEGALEVSGVTVLFQPIVRLGSDEVVGHEALARPRGCGPADSVEPLFEEAQRLGRIRDIDWMCRRAAVETVPWPRPQGWSVFINVRTVTLLDPVHDVDQMLMLLASAGGRPDQVVLEITEHEIISDLGRLTRVLATYRACGFRFALDDVGEGHSTLELLAAADAEYIKIAHSLTNASDAPGPRAAIRAAVAFARSSGATVLAEGIESADVADRMLDFGIELGQGWHLGMPAALAPRGRAVRGLRRRRTA